MTKRDFEEIAIILAKIENEKDFETLISEFSVFLQKKNVYFDLRRFKDKCLFLREHNFS